MIPYLLFGKNQPSIEQVFSEPGIRNLIYRAALKFHVRKHTARLKLAIAAIN